MKILITGAEGQLGDALETVFQDQQVRPFGHAELDITDESRVHHVLGNEKPDLIINSAAYNNVDRAEQEPAQAFAVNEKGPLFLARSARRLSVPIVHVSTDYVFDGKKGKPYLESDPVNPLSVYGRSKLAGEEAVRSTTPDHFIVRTAWIYHTKGKNFLSTMLALSQQGPVRVVNDQFSSPTYAFLLAQAIARRIAAKRFGTYHIAGAGAASRYEQLVEFYRCLGVSYSVEPTSMASFSQAAVRPVYSALASEHDPEFILPPWKEGIRMCAAAWPKKAVDAAIKE